jgi:hypothetical protein
MAIPEITYTFYDFEIEPISDSPTAAYLVKVLSVDGRRFTYEVRGELTGDAINYIKSLIDAVVFSDVIVEETVDGFEAREATKRLKKHS